MGDGPETPCNPTVVGDQSEAGARNETTTESSSPLSMTMVFSVLSDRRRRYVLHVLREQELPITLPELADEVARKEMEGAKTEVPAETLERVHISLWHSHVPKLSDVGIVEHNREQGTVTLAETADQLEPYMAAVTE